MAVLVVLMAAAAYLTVGAALMGWLCRDDPSTDEFDQALLALVWPAVVLVGAAACWMLALLWLVDKVLDR